MGSILLDIGRIDESLKHLEPSVEEARKVHRDGTMSQGELMLAYAYYLKNETKQCLEYLRQYYNHSNQVNVSVRS
jgi:outer membrane protein assembly factor BamD (BamD/ComL family)